MLLWYFWQCSILGNGKDRHMQCTWTCSLESHVKRDRWLFRTKDNDGPQVVSLPHTFRTQEYREPFVTISGSKTKKGKNGRLFLYCLKKKKIMTSSWKEANPGLLSQEEARSRFSTLTACVALCTEMMGRMAPPVTQELRRTFPFLVGTVQPLAGARQWQQQRDGVQSNIHQDAREDE